MQKRNDLQIQDFQAAVWDYYHEHGRHDLPWRLEAPDGSFNPYHIFVSELMLQQTQVPRVMPKYLGFIAHFPDVASLAQAPLAEVLKLWSGLGYNRRAKFLWLAAQQIMREHDGIFPDDRKSLERLPGVGPNTAGAVLAYAFNQPVIFIETNIRSVYIHHFFQDQQDITDKEILALLEQTLETAEPRTWYWALMDYGSFLKKSVGNLNQASKSYVKQSPFQGSRRQIRGQVIQALLTRPQSFQQLVKLINDPRLKAVLDELETETFISLRQNKYHLLEH